MSMKNIFLAICAIAILAVPIVFTVLNIMKVRKKKKSLGFEITAFSVGTIMAVLSYALLEPIYYKDAINSDNGPVLHEAFNRYHGLTLIVFLSIGLLSYFILKFAKKEFAPFVEAFLISGVFISVIASILAAVQLAAGFKADYAYITVIIYLYLFLFNYLFLVWNLLIGITKEKAEKQREVNYKNHFLQSCSSWLLKGANMYLGAVILMIPLLALLILILIIFGQQPDSAIRVFTQTSDWVLSTKISPPAVESGSHYLCTVSIQGHKKLVKPTRFGIRNGEKIVVNRQLCVANAFEQLIMEKTPRFHRALRNFYDTYGYPISKFIKKAWVADIVYLIMKPLEWLFIIVLYTFDQRPEDRIAKQYLPVQ